MLGKTFFLALIVVVAVLSACDARYIKHKKHQQHHERGSKKNFIGYMHVRPSWRKQIQGQAHARCCASAQAGFTPGDPYACCQSASAPPCCQQTAQFQSQVPAVMQPPQPYMQSQGFMPSSQCCSESGAPMTAGQSPYSCCQSATPPPCCQQSAQFQPQMPPPHLFMQSPGFMQSAGSMPSQGCCSQSGASMMPGQSPYSCCQSSSPPPCCNQAMAAPQQPQMSMQTSSGCCSSSPSPPDPNGIYLGLIHPDQHCCQASNPPPCCFGLHLKPGQSKNISMNGGGKNYVLSVHLSNGTKANTTTNPCNVPTCAPPTSIPTSAATSSPTSGPTGAGSTGPSNATTSAPTTSSNGSTTPSPSPGGGGGNECQNKALAEHNAKRQIHNASPMTLDTQLNTDAQAFAESLASRKKVEHSPQNERQGQGENLAKRCSKPDSGFDCKAATDMWYDEVQKYDWGSPGYNGATGHFTQLVWKASTKLGVGKASYVDDAGSTCYVVVARYKPAGNTKGQFPANVEKGSYVGRRSNLLE